MQNARFIPAEVERGAGGGAVHEVKASAHALAQEVEAADAMAGDPIEIVVAACERHVHETDELFLAPGEVLAQTKQPLAMGAKRVEADGDGPTVGPQRFITFKMTGLVVPVTGWIATQQERDNT